LAAIPVAIAPSTPTLSPGRKPEPFETAGPTRALILPDEAAPEEGRLIAPSQVPPAATAPVADSRAAVLFARGLDAEHRGDVSGARRFYFSAAQYGDAAAARNLGRLYDPAYLAQTTLGGVDPNPTLAQHWYERALRLGDTEAAPLLEALSTR
jgi:TPR repeat protein